MTEGCEQIRTTKQRCFELTARDDYVDGPHGSQSVGMTMDKYQLDDHGSWGSP